MLILRIQVKLLKLQDKAKQNKRTQDWIGQKVDWGWGPKTTEMEKYTSNETHIQITRAQQVDWRWGSNATEMRKIIQAMRTIIQVIRKIYK